MKKLFFLLFLFVFPFIGKAQIIPVARTSIMCPVEPPRKTALRFTETVGKAVVVTKYVAGLDYNTYSKRLVNSANQGNAKAQFALWYLYYHGQGVNVDNEKALRYLQMAANKGLAPALHQLGICYLDGIGVKADKKLAAKCFEQSAEKGDINAHTYLA